MNQAFFHTNASPPAESNAKAKSASLSKCHDDEDIKYILTKDYFYRGMDIDLIRETLEFMSDSDNAFCIFISPQNAKNLNSTE